MIKPTKKISRIRQTNQIAYFTSYGHIGNITKAKTHSIMKIVIPFFDYVVSNLKLAYFF